MSRYIRFTLIFISLGFAGIAASQTHHSNWLHRDASDTTMVHSDNDSLTHMRVPPESMGMMHPDSMYCRIDIMPLDSLHPPYDTAFIGWCQIRLGEDSLNYGYMHYDSAHGVNHHQMQFMRELQCRIFWDSLRVDSTRRHWRPTGIRGWTGIGWVTVPAVTFTGNIASFSTTDLYSAYAFIGEPASLSAVDEQEFLPAAFKLSQNYPNPFNPETRIRFRISAPGVVHLAIFNTLGQKIRVLFDQPVTAGAHDVTWDGTNDDGDAVPTGIYLYRLTSSTGNRNVSGSATRKMILVR